MSIFNQPGHSADSTPFSTLQTAVTQGEEATQVWFKSLQDFAIYKKYRAIESEIDQRDRMNRLNPLFVEKFKSSSFFNQAFEYTEEIKNDIIFEGTEVQFDRYSSDWR